MAVKKVRAGAKAKAADKKSKPAMPIGFKGAKKPKKAKTLSAQQREEVRIAEDLQKRVQRRLRQEAVNAAGKKLQDMPADWIPPAMIDAITDATARNPKGGLSLSMEEILHPSEEAQVIIVKTPAGGVTNREEFVEKLGKLGFKVVFLEYKVNFGMVPTIERQLRQV